MSREANLAVPRAPPLTSLARPISSQETSSSSSSSSSSPELLRQVQAAFKRHRPLGTMPVSSIMPRRSVAPRREAVRGSGTNVVRNVGFSTSQDCDRYNGGAKDSSTETKNVDCVIPRESQEDASITPPTIAGTITKMFDASFDPFDVERNQHEMVDDTKQNNPVPLSLIEPQQVDAHRKVQFLTRSTVASHGANDQMATGLENVSSHMGSLALTEMEWNASSQLEASTVVNNEIKIHHSQNPESEIRLKPEGGVSSLLAKRTTDAPDHLHQFRNFLGPPVTQSSVVRSSCATTTSVHSTSAPMLNPTTYFSQTRQEGSSPGEVEPHGDLNLRQPGNQEEMVQSMLASHKHTCGIVVDQVATGAQASTSANDVQTGDKDLVVPKEQKSFAEKMWDLQHLDSPHLHKSTKCEELAGDCSNLQCQAPRSKGLSSDVSLEQRKTEKKEKVVSAPAPRKRNYDPDLFFKVNGKLYQRLGKIGSGGSSEVHKVISSDCTIYALKKIKLKGRDYGTAYGFCQEIDYLNKLKGKNNIIQLIDYEVTDKNLLREVMNGSISNKDSRVKDDGYIYMVLEYGEIDLASMLSQKWKERGSSKQSIDENWLRFYWQQILLAVNTIHEERIVHSDLKPANFLLVKGSLKLIDFGIAKAIMSDTTNIQRDSQVGTLSYMSPEAFMCNESDANGNTIKCGRPSDIWSLGCILYQMVYGRTPFADYKTFWSKFKVITDPNHEITYGPVSNPWLLDLMKKCLAWDRNARWRIPQLLQHPFLAPQAPLQPSLTEDRSCRLLHIVAKACVHDEEALLLYSQLSQLINDPVSQTKSESPTSGEQLRLLSQLSEVCVQLQECLGKSEKAKNLSHMP